MDIDRIKQIARNTWGVATPYRQGLIAGLKCPSVQNPYFPESKGFKLFEEGRCYSLSLAGEELKRFEESLNERI